MFGTSDSPTTVLLGHETLIFEFSMSEKGGDQLLGKVHTDLGPKFRKRPKNLPLCVKTPEMTPPPRENAHIYIYIYYYTPLPLNLANKQASNKQASNKHFSFPFWPLLSLIAPGSTLL